jgi:uncharacterized membrane protein YkvA (DUF1232 family)
LRGAARDYDPVMSRPRTCPACGHPQGSSVDCLSCREAAARELAAAAKDVTPAALAARVDRVGRFLARPPWYARAARGRLLERVRLLWMVLNDYLSGRYRALPWKAAAAIAAAIAYVASPMDLVPDFLVPVGWADDLMVVALAWGLVKRELRAYCAWKGLSPAHFGL